MLPQDETTRPSSPKLIDLLAQSDRTMTAHAEKRNRSANAGRQRGRVLLITDQDESRFIETLAGRNIEVVEVSSGTAALISLQRSRPHLVVANPSSRGLRVAELARTLEQSDDGIPLILVGEEPATLLLRRATLVDGAFDYFQLPEELELLVERTRQLVLLRQKIDRLRADADLDHLTGLANRRRFRAALNREVERFRRYSVPCALLMLDVDHLKWINDKFGHPAGDMVIRQIAQILTEVSRDNDTAARLGGEEFGLLLAGISEEKAAAAAERLRAVITQRTIPGVGSVTVSIGVAGCPANASTERALYAASDRALYVAKNAGRNQISVAPPLQDKLPGV